MNITHLDAIARVYSRAFPEQLGFIRDRAHKKALLCPRRAGKSEAGAIYLILEALRSPGARCLYIGLTRETAKRIMWDKLKEITTLARVQMASNEADLQIRFPNGSTIRLMGLDAHEGMAAKVLGDKLKLVVLDEAASFRIDMRGLIKTYLDPATMDEQGTIAMTGTPDPDEARGFFFEVTSGSEPGWSLHTWSTEQNPYTREEYRAKLKEISETDPLFESTDEFRCMYLGLWPRDAKGRVYMFDLELNMCDAAPADIFSRVIAVDLGWTDDTAIVEGGWKHDDPTLYLTHAEKCPGMLLDEIAARVKARIASSKTHLQVVVDGANQQAVQELRRRYGLPLENAEKIEKVAHIRMMNTDMQRGRIKVVRGACAPLIHEWTGCDERGVMVKGATPLVWDKRAEQARPPRKVEDPRCANHCSDGGLYLWRASRAFRETIPTPQGERDINAEMAEKLRAARAKKVREMRNADR